MGGPDSSCPCTAAMALLRGSRTLLCLGALLTAASAHNGTALRGSPRSAEASVGQDTELTSMGSASVCTTCSQCGGQQWAGCIGCPDGQTCVHKDPDVDPWTMVCVSDTSTMACYR